TRSSNGDSVLPSSTCSRPVRVPRPRSTFSTRTWSNGTHAATGGTGPSSEMSRLTFEAEISPGMTTRQVVDLAQRAEHAGFDRLGVSDVVFWPDCFVVLGLIASATTKIELGPMVTNPYSRHPAV